MNKHSNPPSVEPKKSPEGSETSTLPQLNGPEAAFQVDGPNSKDQKLFAKLKRWQWWLLLTINIVFLLAGQASGILLGRFYFDKGGNSKWLATIVQVIGFPILLIPYFLLTANKEPPISSTNLKPSITKVSLIYIVLGILVGGDDMLYSVGLLYLSASTYSLICATQLAFNALFSFFINSQKFTALMFNSVIVLSLSASLLAINGDSDAPTGVTTSKYVVGFVCSLAASALYSLLLSLMQLSFQKVLKKESFVVVFEMQFFTSLVATILCVVGLLASGEWKTLRGEMKGFKSGRVSYVMTLVWTAVSWQVSAVGVVGLIFMVSSLYSNVISTLSLALTPLAAVIVFHDNMNGVKIIALLMAFWGFASFVYQNYLDDVKERKTQNKEVEGCNFNSQ